MKKDQEETGKDTESNPAAKPKARGRPKKMLATIAESTTSEVPLPEKCAVCTNFHKK